MIPRYLYHYTSVETLRLIIQNRTIQFSRLDLLNDPYEGLCEVAGHDYYPGQSQIYCSCWCGTDEESIALWHLYSKSTGVRIKFESTLFGCFKGFQELCTGYAPTIETKDLAVHFLGKPQPIKSIIGPLKMQYLSDPAELQSMGVERKRENVGTDHEFVCNEISILDLGCRKLKHWEYENEWRYLASPFLKNEGSIQALLQAPNSLLEEQRIYVPIISNPLEVVAAPEMPEAVFAELRAFLDERGIPLRKSRIRTKNLSQTFEHKD